MCQLRRRIPYVYDLYSTQFFGSSRECRSRGAQPRANANSVGSTTRDRHAIDTVLLRTVRFMMRFLFSLFFLQLRPKRSSYDLWVTESERELTTLSLSSPHLLVSHHSVPFASRSDWLRATARSTNRVTTMRQRRISKTRMLRRGGLLWNPTMAPKRRVR